MENSQFCGNFKAQGIFHVVFFSMFQVANLFHLCLILKAIFDLSTRIFKVENSKFFLILKENQIVGSSKNAISPIVSAFFGGTRKLLALALTKLLRFTMRIFQNMQLFQQKNPFFVHFDGPK